MRLPSQRGKKPISRNVSAEHWIIIVFHFISGIYELSFGEDKYFTGKKIKLLNSVMYFPSYTFY
jgi:hypothetical protein